MTHHEKRPRQYAAEIVRMPREQQASAIAAVPAPLRGAVQHFVADWPVRLVAAVHASSQICLRLPRGERVSKLRSLPLWKRRRVVAEMYRISGVRFDAAI